MEYILKAIHYYMFDDLRRDNAPLTYAKLAKGIKTILRKWEKLDFWQTLDILRAWIAMTSRLVKGPFTKYD